MTDIELIREAVEKLKAGCSTSDFFAALYELDTFNPAPVVNQQLTTDSKPSAQVPEHLAKFYQTTDVMELISIMERQIKRLQERPSKDSQQIRTHVREG